MPHGSVGWHGLRPPQRPGVADQSITTLHTSEAAVKRSVNMTGISVSSILALAFGVIATEASAQSLDELYSAAKQEGALSLNGGGPAGLYEPWVREFEQRFPGIKVTLAADFSNILAPKIDRQLALVALNDLTGSFLFALPMSGEVPSPLSRPTEEGNSGRALDFGSGVRRAAVPCRGFVQATISLITSP